MNTQEMIAVLNAAAAGQQIQFRRKNHREDWNGIDEPSFDFFTYDYRVKPEEPKQPLDCWVTVFDSGEVGYAYSHEEHAKAPPIGTQRRVHVREVLPAKARRFTSNRGFDDDTDYVEICNSGTNLRIDKIGRKHEWHGRLEHCEDYVRLGFWRELEVP
jgi:hypothetical protein